LLQQARPKGGAAFGVLALVFTIKSNSQRYRVRLLHTDLF
jgi:hypothetical protein